MDQRLKQSDKQMHVLKGLARHYKYELKVIVCFDTELDRPCCKRHGAHLSSPLIDQESLQTSLSAQESSSDCGEP